MSKLEKRVLKSLLYIVLPCVFISAGGFNERTILFAVLITLFFFLTNEILFPIIERNKKKKVIVFLKSKYNNAKRIDDNCVEIILKNKTIRVEPDCDAIRKRYDCLNVFVNISDYEEEILKKLKIHFYVEFIDDVFWVSKTIDNDSNFFNNLEKLVERSDKEIIKIIDEIDDYINTKILSSI